MPDFSKLMNRPAGEAKKPPVLPVGDYAGVLGQWEVGDNNKNRTEYVRFPVRLTGWPDDVTGEDREGIDLSKRQLRRDYYTSDDAMYRLDEFIRSCGIDPSGRSYAEVLPELVGKPVIVEVRHYINQQTQELGNQINGMRGA